MTAVLSPSLFRHSPVPSKLVRVQPNADQATKEVLTACFASQASVSDWTMSHLLYDLGTFSTPLSEEFRAVFVSTMNILAEVHAQHEELVRVSDSWAKFYAHRDEWTMSKIALAGLAGSGDRILESLAKVEIGPMALQDATVSTPRWMQLVMDAGAATGVDELTESVESVYELIDQSGPGAVRLDQIPDSSVNGEHLAAVLRATAPFKHMTPGWDRALKIAQRELSKNDVDLEDALAGLQ